MSFNEVPWFMLSPSPMSLAQYAILSFVMSRYFLKTVEYRRAPQLLSLIDGFLVSAFFVVLTDGFWCLFCSLRWLPLYPGDLVLMVHSILRDAAASSLFLLLILAHFKSGVLQFSRRVLGFVLLSFFSQAAWFALAPSPAYTDYTYAWRHGASLELVIAGFFLSHFLMRLPLWAAILSTRKEQGIIDPNKTGHSDRCQ